MPRTIPDLLRAMILPIVALLLLAGCSSMSGPEEDDDDIPPSVVSDLAVAAFTDMSVTLTWTATGDDGDEGTASTYDLRYMDRAFMWDEWDDALRATGEPAPSEAGATEQMTISGLTPDATYWFVLRVADDQDNSAGLSNFVQTTCFVDGPVTIPDAALEAVLREHLDIPAGDLMRSDLRGLYDLRAESEGIVDLTGLEECRELDHANLWDNDIIDVSPLAGLSKLVELTLNANAVADVSPLAGLTGLTALRLENNAIIDISPLAPLESLQTFWIGGNTSLADISVVSDMTALTVLMINNTAVDDLAPVAGLATLTSLRASNLDLDTLTPLAGLTNLTTLELFQVGVADIAPLAGMTAMENLTLSYNGIADISPLTGMTALNYLSLNGNAIADLQPLVDNAGLGEGDQVWVANNPLSAASIETHVLEARGVIVHQ